MATDPGGSRADQAARHDPPRHQHQHSRSSRSGCCKIWCGHCALDAGNTSFKSQEKEGEGSCGHQALRLGLSLQRPPWTTTWSHTTSRSTTVSSARCFCARPFWFSHQGTLLFLYRVSRYAGLQRAFAHGAQPARWPRARSDRQPSAMASAGRPLLLIIFSPCDSLADVALQFSEPGEFAKMARHRMKKGQACVYFFGSRN